MPVFVFKTSVDTTDKLNLVTSNLNEILPGAKWNFDLEDCDNILRIESEFDISAAVTEILKSMRFDCIELE